MYTKKKTVIIVVTIFALLLVLGGFKLYSYLRVKYAKIEVDLVNDLTLEFNDKKKVSDYIENINGKIINDYIINSTKLGTKKVKVKFINDDNIKVDYSFDVEVKDTVAPLVLISDRYKIAVGSEDTFKDRILCGDNYDSNPSCEIIGEYDLNTVGDYPLTFEVIDNSGNKTDNEFILSVFDPQKAITNTEKTSTNFSDIVKTYKNDNTKIGIDVSRWQGDIDFEKLKKAGVEFIIIRVGTADSDGNIYIDKYFNQNIENANKYGIDAGVYFFSYASSNKQAKKEAKWVLKQIKNYNISLPITFDWEDWSNFNSYNLSFFGLTNMAQVFLGEIEKNGYDGMIYGSKNYLEKIWLKTKYDIWLAHYVDNIDYNDDYKVWQLCNDGKIDGINGNVDIDIMKK